MPPAQPTVRKSPAAMLITVLIVVGVVWVVWEWRSLRSRRDTLHAKTAQLHTLRRDAARILELRTAPRRATERQVPHETLVAAIDRARAQAGLEPTSLASVWPEAPRRVDQSDYLRLATRLHFEQVGLHPITRFIDALCRPDPSVQVTSIRLLSQQPSTALWNIELVVSYLLYAPTKTGKPNLSA